MSKDTSGVVVIAHADTSGMENLFRKAIQEKLGEDRDALKALQVDIFRAENVEQAKALKRLGRRLFVVQGALGLNDSGTNWRAFKTNIEEGLSTQADQEVADALAHECLKCVAMMKREKQKVGLAANDA